MRTSVWCAHLEHRDLIIAETALAVDRDEDGLCNRPTIDRTPRLTARSAACRTPGTILPWGATTVLAVLFGTFSHVQHRREPVQDEAAPCLRALVDQERVLNYLYRE